MSPIPDSNKVNKPAIRSRSRWHPLGPDPFRRRITTDRSWPRRRVMGSVRGRRENWWADDPRRTSGSPSSLANGRRAEPRSSTGPAGIAADEVHLIDRPQPWQHGLYKFGDHIGVRSPDPRCVVGSAPSGHGRPAHRGAYSGQPAPVVRQARNSWQWGSQKRAPVARRRSWLCRSALVRSVPGRGQSGLVRGISNPRALGDVRVGADARRGHGMELAIV